MGCLKYIHFGCILWVGLVMCVTCCVYILYICVYTNMYIFLSLLCIRNWIHWSILVSYALYSTIHNLSQAVVPTPRFDLRPINEGSCTGPSWFSFSLCGNNVWRNIPIMESCTVPKSKIEVLSQEISDDFRFYRIRARQRVHYVTIATNVFDYDTMCRPHLLIPQLRTF